MGTHPRVAVTAREEILARIAAAVPAATTGDIPRDCDGAGEVGRGSAKVLDLFEDRPVDYYRAVVHRAEPAQVAAAIGAALTRAGIVRVVVPAGFPADWLPRRRDGRPG